MNIGTCENCTHLYRSPSWVMHCSTCDRSDTNETSGGFSAALLEWAQVCAHSGHDVVLTRTGA